MAQHTEVDSGSPADQPSEQTLVAQQVLATRQTKQTLVTWRTQGTRWILAALANYFGPIRTGRL